MIGERIKELRQEQDWSTRDLATKAEVAQTMIVRYESNKAMPTNAVLKKLAEIFKVTTEELKSGKGTTSKSISTTDYKLRLTQAQSLKSEVARSTISGVINSFLELEKLQGSIDELARKAKA